MRNLGWLFLTLLLCSFAQPTHAIILNSDQTVETVDVRSLKGILPLAKGGTNANLTASPGGLVYSTNSAFAILPGTATARQIPLSGVNGAPSWSSATYPSTILSGQLLVATASNQIAGVTMSGDCTMNTAGVVDCVASGGATAAGSNGDVQYKSSGNLAGLTLGGDTALGALSAGVPAALSLPNCHASTEALNYTSGVGYSCRTISTSSLVPSIIQKMTSGTTATVAAANTTLSMESAASGAKAIAIPAAGSGNTGQDIVVKDTAGGAAANHIVITPASGTIDGAATATIGSNKNSLTLRSDGAGNWMLI